MAMSKTRENQKRLSFLNIAKFNSEKIQEYNIFITSHNNQKSYANQLIKEPKTKDCLGTFSQKSFVGMASDIEYHKRTSREVDKRSCLTTEMDLDS